MIEFRICPKCHSDKVIFGCVGTLLYNIRCEKCGIKIEMAPTNSQLNKAGKGVGEDIKKWDANLKKIMRTVLANKWNDRADCIYCGNPSDETW